MDARSLKCAAVLIVVIGCGDDGTAPGAGGAGGAGGAAQSGTTGSDATSSIASGNAGGAGGDGTSTATTSSSGSTGGGETVCTPGEEQDCYTGPPGTELVGLCAPGTATCLPDGSGFGACEGETLPDQETCTDPGDEDCDGETNEEGPDCVCIPGTVASCYSADPSTEGVGPCVAGFQICNNDALGYGPCMDEVTPVPESCMTGEDDDCDGETNEVDAGCLCVPNSVTPCYSGPPNTQGVGSCVAGTHVCDSDGMGYGFCIGQITPKPEICTTAADDDCDGVAMPPCPGGDHLWSMRFGGTSSEAAYDVATDSAGNVLIAGTAVSEADFGGGPLPAGGAWDMLIAKLDADGNHVWSKRFGDTQWQEAYSVATDPAGNVLVTGNFHGLVNFGGTQLNGGGSVYWGDVFVVKYDPAGNHIWSADFGTDGRQSGHAIASDADGNIIVLGSFERIIDFGGDEFWSHPFLGYDVFLVKFDPDGNHLWSKRFGETGSQYSGGLAVDATGSIVITGFFDGSVDFGGGLMTAAGGGANTDLFVAKFDPAGNHLWSQQFGDGGQFQSLGGVAVDAMGDIVLAGYFDGVLDLGGLPLVSAGLNDIVVAKLDPDGNHLWSQRFGDAGYQQAFAVALDSGGNIGITGYTTMSPDFGGGPLPNGGGYDAFVVKLDPSGGHLWSRSFGAANDQRPQSIATDAGGNFIVGGDFEGVLDFGGNVMTSAGNYDGFVAKLSP